MGKKVDLDTRSGQNVAFMYIAYYYKMDPVDSVSVYKILTYPNSENPRNGVISWLHRKYIEQD